MHLSAAILGWGMARDSASTLFDNFKPGMGGIGLLLHLGSGIPGGKTLGICSAAANLQTELETSAAPVCERTAYVGVSDCYISLVFCSFQLAILRLYSDFIFRKKTTIPSMIIF